MPALAATMSTIASTAPTSWKWMSSMGTLWTLASEAPGTLEGADCGLFDRRGQRGCLDQGADGGEGASVSVLVRMVFV